MQREKRIQAPFAICDFKNKNDIAFITTDLDKEQDDETLFDIFEWYEDELEFDSEKIKDSKKSLCRFSWKNLYLFRMWLFTRIYCK